MNNIDKNKERRGLSRHVEVLNLKPKRNMTTENKSKDAAAMSGVDSSDLLDILLAIQGEAENLPCGGIGDNGATQDDLYAANELGRPVEDDAVYHNGQQIWLIAQKGVSLLSNNELTHAEGNGKNV